jgi:hypothetical protein
VLVLGIDGQGRKEKGEMASEIQIFTRSEGSSELSGKARNIIPKMVAGFYYSHQVNSMSHDALYGCIQRSRNFFENRPN